MGLGIACIIGVAAAFGLEGEKLDFVGIVEADRIGRDHALKAVVAEVDRLLLFNGLYQNIDRRHLRISFFL